MTFLRPVPRGRVLADREKVAQREAPRRGLRALSVSRNQYDTSRSDFFISTTTHLTGSFKSTIDLHTNWFEKSQFWIHLLQSLPLFLFFALLYHSQDIEWWSFWRHVTLLRGGTKQIRLPKLNREGKPETFRYFCDSHAQIAGCWPSSYQELVVQPRESVFSALWLARITKSAGRGFVVSQSTSNRRDL